MNATDLAALNVPSIADDRLPEAQAQALAAALQGWAIADGALHKTLRFADFHQTMAFVNAVAWVAHRCDHHPDFSVGYNRCGLRWSTHSAGGLTLKDFACAAQVDALGANPPQRA